MKELASKFKISSGGVRGSVVTFSTESELSIRFNDHSSTSSFNNAIDNIPFMGFQTRIDKALRTTQREMLNAQNGARASVVKVVILLTDGTQTRTGRFEDPAAIAEELRNAGVHLVVVGIGSDVSSDELTDIAGDRSYVFTANNFDQLVTKEFINQVGKATCGECFKLLRISLMLDSLWYLV